MMYTPNHTIPKADTMRKTKYIITHRSA